MSQPKVRSSEKDSSDVATIELYRTAFARLNFQDDYLFKFSTVFLTAHGALAVLAGAEFRSDMPNRYLLLVLSVVGFVLAITWLLWTRHNDYWHSVWTGALRNLEDSLNPRANLFLTDHRALAVQGGRSKRFVLRGHSIARVIPICFGLGWLVLLIYSLGIWIP